MRHAHHDAIVNEVRSWFRHLQASEESKVEKRHYGFYSWAKDIPQECHVLIETLEPKNVADFVKDLRT